MQNMPLGDSSLEVERASKSRVRATHAFIVLAVFGGVQAPDLKILPYKYPNDRVMHIRPWYVEDVSFDGSTSPVKREVVTSTMRADMYTDQTGACAYCQGHLTQLNFDADHIIPVRYGGPTCRTNLHLICVPCHRRKTGKELRTSGKQYRTDVPISSSVVVKTNLGFPLVRPADLPQLPPGVYTLDFGPHIKPRPAAPRHVKTPRKVEPMTRKYELTPTRFTKLRASILNPKCL